jgi:hypothetical protein
MRGQWIQIALSWACISGVTAVSTASFCADIVTARPDWAIGDNWQFARKNVRTGEQSPWSRKVVALLPNGVRIADENNRTWLADPDFNAFNARGAEYRTFWWHWPLQVGEAWEYRSKVHIEVGSREDVVKRKVVGYERIKVPAGEFDCFRIASSGTRFEYDATKAYRPASSNRTEFVSWFCPTIRFIARQEEHFVDGYGGSQELVSELTSYFLAR